MRDLKYNPAKLIERHPAGGCLAWIMVFAVVITVLAFVAWG